MSLQHVVRHFQNHLCRAVGGRGLYDVNCQEDNIKKVEEESGSISLPAIGVPLVSYETHTHRMTQKVLWKMFVWINVRVVNLILRMS